MNQPNLVATEHGAIHLDTCRLITGPTTPITVPDSGALARQIARSGNQSCRVCRPVSRLAFWEHQQRKPKA